MFYIVSYSTNSYNKQIQVAWPEIHPILGPKDLVFTNGSTNKDKFYLTQWGSWAKGPGDLKFCLGTCQLVRLNG